MIGYPSGQDGAILPARDCPFCSRNKILPKHESFFFFFFHKIFSVTVKRFSVIFLSGLQNEKTEGVNKKESKETKNVEFQEYILQQKPANKSKNAKRHEGVEWLIINLLLTKLVQSR